MMMNGYGFGFGFGGLLMLLFWVFVIALVVWLVLTLVQQRPAGGDPASARRILDERLARGELDVEEYRTRRAALDEPGR